MNNLFNINNVQLILVVLSLLTSGMGAINLGISFVPSLASVQLLFTIGMLRSFKRANLLLNVQILILFAFIFLVSYGLNNQYYNLGSIKQLVGLIIFGFAFYWYVRQNQERMTQLVCIYIAFACFISIVGIIQEIAFLFNFEPLYNFSHYGIMSYNLTYSGPFLRINSIASEPAHLAYMLLPACYFAILRFFRNRFVINLISKWQAIIILLAMALTFSVIGYFAVLIVLLFAARRQGSKKLFVALFVILIIALISFSFIPNIQKKIVSASTVATISDVNNISSFALFSNLLVAWESLRENIMFGSGINTHQINYDKYIGRYFQEENIFMRINSADAGSLLIRIPSELGVLGCFVVLAFLYHFKVKRYEAGNAFYYINTMGIIGIFGYSIRCGGYLEPILWLMIAFYLCSFMENRINYAKE